MRYITLILILLNAPVLAKTKLSKPVIHVPEDGQKHGFQLGPVDECLQLQKKNIKFIKQLASFLDRSNKVKIQGELNDLSGPPTKLCRNPKKRAKLRSLFTSHKKKLGVILPLSGEKRKVGKQFKNAIKLQAKRLGINKNDLLIVDSGSNARGFHRQLAKLVFVDKVSMIIGGATSYGAKMLNLWSDKYLTPTIILHNHTFSHSRSPYSFFVSPDPMQMAQSLSAYIQNRGLRRIAIFHPENQSRILVNSFRHQLKKHGSKVKKILHYNGDNRDSLELALRELFLIDSPNRQKEMENLMWARRLERRRAGLPYDTKGLILPPVVTVDGIVFLGNFKMARHLINTMKYLKVPKIPLFGTQQLRAPELFTPSEPYLAGSVFVDFIGSYKELPHKIKPKTWESPFFTTPKEVVSTDINLIVAHGIHIAKRSLKNAPKDKRNIRHKMRLLRTPKQSQFFASKRVFDRRQMSHWPTFLFSLSEDKMFNIFNRAADTAKLKIVPYLEAL